MARKKYQIFVLMHQFLQKIWINMRFEITKKKLPLEEQYLNVKDVNKNGGTKRPKYKQGYEAPKI